MIEIEGNSDRADITPRVDICATCISPRPPKLPLREEVLSLGFEIILDAEGVGDRASRREAHRALETFRANWTRKVVKKSSFWLKSSKRLRIDLEERRRFEKELQTLHALSYDEYENERAADQHPRKRSGSSVTSKSSAWTAATAFKAGATPKKTFVVVHARRKARRFKLSRLLWRKKKAVKEERELVKEAMEAAKFPDFFGNENSAAKWGSSTKQRTQSGEILRSNEEKSLGMSTISSRVNEWSIAGMRVLVLAPVEFTNFLPGLPTTEHDAMPHRTPSDSPPVLQDKATRSTRSPVSDSTFPDLLPPDYRVEDLAKHAIQALTFDSFRPDTFPDDLAKVGSSELDADEVLRLTKSLQEMVPPNQDMGKEDFGAVLFPSYAAVCEVAPHTSNDPKYSLPAAHHAKQDKLKAEKNNMPDVFAAFAELESHHKIYSENLAHQQKKAVYQGVSPGQHQDTAVSNEANVGVLGNVDGENELAFVASNESWFFSAKQALGKVLTGACQSKEQHIQGAKSAPTDGTPATITTIRELLSQSTAPKTTIVETLESLDDNALMDRSCDGRVALHLLCSRALPDRCDQSDVNISAGLLDDIGEWKALIGTLVARRSEACAVLDFDGDLPVHLASRVLMEWEATWYERVYNMAAKAGESDQTTAGIITQLYQGMSETVDILLQEVAEHPELCREGGSVGMLLPCHITAIFTSPAAIVRKILEAYPQAAHRACNLDGLKTFIPDECVPIELHEHLSTDFPKWEREIREEQIQLALSRPGVDNHFSKVSIRRSDLFFAFNPTVEPFRYDRARLGRIEKRIQQEAQTLLRNGCSSLSSFAERCWVFLCTFVEPRNGIEPYVNNVSSIVGIVDPEVALLLSQVLVESHRTVLEACGPQTKRIIDQKLRTVSGDHDGKLSDILHSPKGVMDHIEDYDSQTSQSDDEKASDDKSEHLNFPQPEPLTDESDIEAHQPTYYESSGEGSFILSSSPLHVVSTYESDDQISSCTSDLSWRQEFLTSKYSFLFPELEPVDERVADVDSDSGSASDDLDSRVEEREPRQELLRVFCTGERVWNDMTDHLTNSQFQEDYRILQLKVGIANEAKRLGELSKIVTNVHARYEHLLPEIVLPEENKPSAVRRLLLRLCEVEERILVSEIGVQHLNIESRTMMEEMKEFGPSDNGADTPPFGIATNRVVERNVQVDEPCSDLTQSESGHLPGEKQSRSEKRRLEKGFGKTMRTKLQAQFKAALTGRRSTKKERLPSGHQSNKSSIDAFACLQSEFRFKTAFDSSDGSDSEVCLVSRTSAKQVGPSSSDDLVGQHPSNSMLSI